MAMGNPAVASLDEFVTPIGTLTTPAPPGAGRLSSARAARLDADLRALNEARGDAWAALRADGRRYQ